MRSIAAKVFIIMAITAIAAFGADSSLGTWKYNITRGRTSSTSTNPLVGAIIVWESTPDGGVKQTVTGRLADGTPVNYSFTLKYDGKEYPATGAPFDTISAQRIDANTWSWDAKKTGGKYHVHGITVISKDGKTMTQTSIGTDTDGTRFSSTFILDRQQGL